MIKAHLDIKNGRSMIKWRGTNEEILADATYLIHHLFNSYGEDDAETFKYLIQTIIADDASPVWERKEKPGKKMDGITNILFKFPWQPE